MATTTKSIKDLLQLVDEGDLVLPEIQRDFVWNFRNVEMLFDSLYRGLPIGHLLVWKTKKTDVTTRKFLHKPRDGAMRRFYGYLLDGQQRLSAISLVRDRNEAFPLLFKLRPEDAGQPDTARFVRASKRHSNDAWCVPVADVLAASFSPMQAVERLRKDARDYDRRRDDDVAYNGLARLQRVLEYNVGVTEFESEVYREATELFIRFNSTGKHLKKTDLAIAELALVVSDIVSNEMGKTANQYQGFVFTRDFLIRCLVAVHTGQLDLRDPKEAWGDSDEPAIRRSWARTARGLGRAINLVTGTVHWKSHLWMSSINALLPLVYVLAHGSNLSARDRLLARKWLLLASFHRSFSGSGHGDIDRILRRLQGEPTVARLWAVTKTKLPRLRPDDFEVSHRSGPAMSLYVSMLRDRGARDWVNRTALDGTVLGHNSKLEVHHFFPRALLARKGIDSREINTFANYAIIDKGTNLGISDEEPAAYVARLRIRPKDLADQCIPEDRSLWAVSRYGQFLADRRALLAKRANDYLG